MAFDIHLTGHVKSVVEATLSLAEAYTGTRHRMTISRRVVCKGCSSEAGLGSSQRARCRRCGECPREVKNVNVQFANMKQDMELVSRELAGLRTEVELLRRENAQLRVSVEQLTRRQNSTSGDAHGLSRQMDARLQSLERRATQGEKEQIALQKNFDKKLKDLIAEMNAAFSQVNGPSPGGASGDSFSTDYPKNGFVHKVEKGETVSSIAVKYSSKIKWIIDSNRISDPTKVFVGKELFVPQK